MSILKLVVVVMMVIVVLLFVLHVFHHFVCGVNMGKTMPGWGFEAMTKFMGFLDLFHDTSKRLDLIDIRKGDTLCDYGTGPGRLLPKASKLVGDDGMVYAVDSSRNAKYHVEKTIKINHLKNVRFVWVKDGLKNDLEDDFFDVIMALDIFHMVKEHVKFLEMLHRICKPRGFLAMDDGHQSRQNTLRKIKESKVWEIEGTGKEKILKLIHL